MLRETGPSVETWAERLLADVSEITLEEIDDRPPPKAVPISGWRRLTGAMAGVLGGILVFVLLLWTGMRLFQLSDEAIERLAGPGPEVVAPSPTAEVAPLPETPAAPSFTWITHGPQLGLPFGDATVAAIGPDGAVWVAIDAPGQIRVATQAGDRWIVRDEGLDGIDGTPRWMAAATDGSIWLAVSTAEGGADRLIGFDGETWTVDESIETWGSVVREGSGGQLWVAGLDREMRPIRVERVEDRWESARAATAVDVDGVEGPAELRPGRLMWRIALGGDGAAWFAGDDVIVRFDGRHVTSTIAGPRPWVAIGPDGAAWTPTDHGLRRHAGNVWTYYDARHGLPGTPPTPGTIRFGTNDTWALFRSGGATTGYAFDGSTWTETPAPPAGSGLALLPPGAPRLAYTPEALAVAELDDVVWVRTGRNWSPLRNPDGLPFDAVHTVVQDPSGTLWMASDGRWMSVDIGEE